jgi:hypothetical protein
MSSDIVHARARTIWAALLGVTAAFALSASVALAAPPGNNGTVKIHDGATDSEPVINNEPHVCTFHLHFFFADPFQSGDWWIREWPPTGDGSVVMSGTYDTDPSGEDRVPTSGSFGLDPGHYKLLWQGDESNLIKHKVFWVGCPEEGGPLQDEPTPTPFDGAMNGDSTGSNGTGSATLALLLGAGSAAATLLLLRPTGRRVDRD